MSEARVDEAVAAGLSDIPEADEPERVQPEIVNVDVSGAMTEPDDPTPPEGAEVHHLPVRQEVVEHATLGTLIPLQDEMRGIAQLAVTLATASTMPKALKDKPADVLAIILTGRELGVAPMTAIRMFHVIGGTVTLAPKIRLAMVRQQGLGKVYPHQPPTVQPCALLITREDHGDDCQLCDGTGLTKKLCPCGVDTFEGAETDPEVATWHAERHDMLGIIFTSTYTLAMAGAVEYIEWQDGKKVKKKLADKDNWQNYPAQMCQWRSLGYVLDQAFSEVGTGLYSPDEVGAVTDDQGEPILDVTSTEVLVPADVSPAAQARSRAEARKKQSGGADDPVAPPDTIATFKARIEKIKLYPDAATALMAMWNGKRSSGDPVEALPKIDELRYRHCKMASALIDLIEKQIGKGEFGKPQEPQQDPAPDGPDTPPDDGHAHDEGEHEPPAEDDPEAEPDSGDETPPSDAPDSPQDPPVAPDEPSAPSDPAPEPGGTLSLDVDSLPTDGSPAADLAWTEAAMQADPLWTRQLLDDVATEVQAIETGDLTGVLKALDMSSNGLSETTRRARIAARRARLRIQKAAGL